MFDSSQPAQLHRLARVLKINSDLGSMSMRTIKTVNNEDPGQTVQMHRLNCTFVDIKQFFLVMFLICRIIARDFLIVTLSE